MVLHRCTWDFQNGLSFISTSSNNDRYRRKVERLLIFVEIFGSKQILYMNRQIFWVDISEVENVRLKGEGGGVFPNCAIFSYIHYLHYSLFLWHEGFLPQYHHYLTSKIAQWAFICIFRLGCGALFGNLFWPQFEW